jgi:hypothetical protein
MDQQEHGLRDIGAEGLAMRKDAHCANQDGACISLIKAAAPESAVSIEEAALPLLSGLLEMCHMDDRTGWIISQR